MAYKTIQESRAYQKRLRKRRKYKQWLTAEYLRSSFAYDPDTGEFFKRLGNHRRSAHHDGYFYICVNGVVFSAHRLAWLYMTGKWPRELIDHKNGDKLDNRFANLREATHLQNFWNRAKRADNTSGYKGVCFNKKLGKYVAYVNKQQRGRTVRHYLGLYDTAEKAHAAYRKVAKKLHGEFARFE